MDTLTVLYLRLARQADIYVYVVVCNHIQLPSVALAPDCSRVMILVVSHFQEHTMSMIA